MDNEKIKKEVDKKIDTLVDQGITSTTTIDALDKLIDIKKDMLEIEKMEKYKYQGEYGEYGNYSEGGYNARGNYREGGYQEGNYGNDTYNRRRRDSQGRFMERGVDSRYRGHDKLDRMYMEYGNYSAGREEYNRDRGNYGAKEDTMHSLKAMLESCVDFFEMLKREASTQEEMELIKKYAKQISEM